MAHEENGSRGLVDAERCVACPSVEACMSIDQGLSLERRRMTTMERVAVACAVDCF